MENSKDIKIMLILASKMLDMANDEFSNHSCNDLPDNILKMIPESFLEDMRQLNSKGTDPWPEKVSQIHDTSLMWYLSKKLEQMSTIIDRDIKINVVLDEKK